MAKNHPDTLLSSKQTAQERFNFLRLARTPAVGPITFARLLKKFGSASSVIEQATQQPELQRLFNTNPLPPISKIEHEIHLTERQGGKFIFLHEANYPNLLRFIADPPPVITVLGRQDLLQSSMMAIVGARQASVAGKKIAELFSAGLGREGLIIVSGMARGIDKAAHQHALATGTIAVVAGGVDHIYPLENKELYSQIKDQGLIISEQPWGTVPQAGFFPRRNRIISGLSLGVLIIEASEKSGSLITAKFALEQGREVFAVPGSPLDDRSYGTNNLIRQGAILTQRLQDILEVIPLTKTDKSSHRQEFQSILPPLIGLNKASLKTVDQGNMNQLIMEKLSPIPISIDELANECQLSLADLRNIVTELEIDGKVRRHLGDKISLTL